MALESYFVEIFLNNQNCTGPNFIDVYVSEIKPSSCRTFVDELSKFLSSNEELIDRTGSVIFPSLTHLRRVRRRTTAINACKQKPSTKDDTSSSSNEPLVSFKTNVVVKLEVLLTSVQFLDYIISSNEKVREQWNSIVNKYDLRVIKISVPGRSAISKEEINEWKSRQNDDLDDEKVEGLSDIKITSFWPTVFFPEKTHEYMLSKLELTNDDIQYMRNGMMEAINDSKQHRSISCRYIPGAVILSPSTKRVVASSFQELKLQTDLLHTLDHGIDMDLLQVNPLCTPILLSIQGISRRERCSIAAANDNADDPSGQVRISFELLAYTVKESFTTIAVLFSVLVYRVRIFIITCKLLKKTNHLFLSHTHSIHLQIKV